MQVSFAGVVASDVIVVACLVAVLCALALTCNAACVLKPDFRVIAHVIVDAMMHISLHVTADTMLHCCILLVCLMPVLLQYC